MVQNNSMLDKVNSVLQQVQTFPQIKKKQKKSVFTPHTQTSHEDDF